MNRSIILATDVEADRARVFEVLSTTEGQRGSGPRTATCPPTGPGSASRRRPST